MNLPNSITFARLILTAVFVVSASWGGTTGLIVALVTFIIATISDWLDGYLARKLNLVTSLGKLLDPLADKILVASAFVYFTSVNLCPVWVTAVIIGREFLVTGLIFDSSGPHEGLFASLQSLTSPDNWLFLSFLWGALALTLLSGINYLRKSWNLLLD